MKFLNKIKYWVRTQIITPVQNFLQKIANRL